MSPNDADRPPVRRFAHDAMACTFELLLCEPDARYAAQAADEAFAELDRLEDELSRFVPTSDVARINRLQPGEAVTVCEATLECLELADQIARLTGGAFDAAYASDPPAAGPPLMVDRRGGRVAATRAGVQLDLGGSGKGYARDRLAWLLRQWDITRALLHAGQSTALACGPGPDGAGWRLPLRDPRGADHPLGHVCLRDAALSGSGRTLHGAHIVDPRTGNAAAGHLATWAVAPSAALADGLSTAAMVLDEAAIRQICRRAEGVAIGVLDEGADRPRWIDPRAAAGFTPAGESV